MLCVVCPHCHQMMTAPVDAVGESVACPSCKKTLQVPPNAPRLPQHLTPGGAPPAAAPHARAAAVGAAGGRVGAAVAAPPVPVPPPNLGTAAPQTRSTLPKGLLVVIVLVVVVAGIGAAVIIPKLGSKKTVISKKKDIPSLPGVDPGPPDVIPPSDLTAASLFKAYFDNSSPPTRATRKNRHPLRQGGGVRPDQGELFVNLYGIDRSRDLTKIVRCYFPDRHKDRLKALVHNQPIRVKGTCKGMTDGRVVIRECNFVTED